MIIEQAGRQTGTIRSTMAYLATIASFGFADFDPPELLAVYKDLGCVALQYYRNEANPPDLSYVKQVADDLGLRYDSIHGVFGKKYDPSSRDETFRKASVEVYRAEAELALELGGPKIVVHPGAPTADGKAADPKELAMRLTPLLKSMTQLAQMGEELGVTFLMENIPHTFYAGSDPAALAAMLREINSPNLKMCFDTGHAHMTCDVVEHFSLCKDMIDYMHISDNNQKFDSHLLPGHGSIDWDRLGPLMTQFDGAAMLELFFPLGMMQMELNNGLAAHLKEMLKTS